jgi:hypothetical protein
MKFLNMIWMMRDIANTVIPRCPAGLPHFMVLLEPGGYPFRFTINNICRAEIVLSIPV